MQTIIELHLLDKNAKLVSLHKKQLQFEDTSYLPPLPAPSPPHLNLSCCEEKKNSIKSLNCFLSTDNHSLKDHNSIKRYSSASGLCGYLWLCSNKT